MNEAVTKYFQKQPEKSRLIMERLREIILKTLPGVEEDFLWGVPVYDGGRFYLASLKKQVNLGFSIVGLSKDEITLFEGSGKTARHIKVDEMPAKQDEERIVELLKLVKQKAGIPK